MRRPDRLPHADSIARVDWATPLMNGTDVRRSATGAKQPDGAHIEQCRAWDGTEVSAPRTIGGERDRVNIHRDGGAYRLSAAVSDGAVRVICEPNGAIVCPAQSFVRLW